MFIKEQPGGVRKHEFPNFFVIKPTRWTFSQIYFVMKLYLFRTVRLPIIRSLFTVHSAMVYVVQVPSRIRTFHPDPARKLSTNLYDIIPLLSVQWINSWWWTDELSETGIVLWQNTCVKLVHLVGFITNKPVTMHGHMDAKKKKWICQRNVGQ